MSSHECSFVLPVGYVDASGVTHREGIMRLATAIDEVEPHQDARVRANENYIGILILSRVVVRLGTIQNITPSVIERLFARDYSFLQELFLRLNSLENLSITSRCPRCAAMLQLDPWK